MNDQQQHESVAPAADASISHEDAIRYWSSVESSVDGVLGGYPQISRVDLRGSLTFIAKLKKLSSSSSSLSTTNGEDVTQQQQQQQQQLFARAVDCGAGIGRVTAGCLSQVAVVVDAVEPVGKFAEQMRSDLAAATATATAAAGGSTTNKNVDGSIGGGGGGGGGMTGAGRLGTVYEVGLEEWTPAEGAYDIIWNQWCLGQLTDDELTAYLRRCVGGLVPGSGGWICVKENLNTAPDGSDLFDELDSSVTRSDASWCRIFRDSGLRVVMHEMQRGFPKQLGLYPVKMYALRPA